MDLTYACGQLPLSLDTRVQCNFSLIWGKSTGTFRLKTSFYGLATMQAEFQRVMDSIFSEFLHAHAFIDNIYFLKDRKLNTYRRSRKKLKKLDKLNMAQNLTMCKFAQQEFERFGQKITSKRVTHLIRKTVPSKKLKPPRTLSQLKSLMGSIHRFHKNMPALAESSAPLRPLLSREKDYMGTPDCQAAFDNLKNQKLWN